uniref:Uncharacterized protein n=1 Tax=Magnetospirillum gryphiswaldense TaxID=55518 RepID=A4TVX7_9PROT|nr:hypothetical protein MGR_2781 [Magnetospirillum gryphiswaldense MSR-1]
MIRSGHAPSHHCATSKTNAQVGPGTMNVYDFLTQPLIRRQGAATSPSGRISRPARRLRLGCC